MKPVLRLIPLLCLGWAVISACAGEPEDARPFESVQPGDPLRRVKPRSPSDIPPGLKKLFAQYAEGYFTETQGNRDVFATEVQSRLRAGESLFLVDVRDAASYGKGHLPTATHIPIETLFAEEVLETLPTDGTPIIVICASGHVASQAVGALGALGYNAYALRFGMIGWNRTTPVQVYSSTQVPQTINGLGGTIEQ
jgi:rhodanese-related sulfurtransferase